MAGAGVSDERWEFVRHSIDTARAARDDVVHRAEAIEISAFDQRLADICSCFVATGVDVDDVRELLAAGAGIAFALDVTQRCCSFVDPQLLASLIGTVQLNAYGVVGDLLQARTEASVEIDGPRRFRLTREGERPWTLNGERKWSPRDRAAAVRQWRSDFAWLAKAEHLPRLERIAVTATPLLKTNAGQDVGGCFPAAKAAIDGLKDAGVIEDDGPTVVRSLAFNAPVLAAPVDGLRLDIEELPA